MRPINLFRKGLDTHEISQRLNLPESKVLLSISVCREGPSPYSTVFENPFRGEFSDAYVIECRRTGHHPLAKQNNHCSNRK